MSESPTPPTVTSPANESATMSADPLETSTTASDKTVTASARQQTLFPDYLPSSGAAIFSTNLCTQSPIAVSNPPHPVIPRSGDKIKAVVDAGHFWERKFRWQCLCIFPGQGWVIEDLWDAADIHLDTATFLGEVLTFISRDTYYHAKAVAEKWSRTHPDRLELVGGDMKGMYNPKNPLAIVDKVFVNGETNEYPKTFLWHLLSIMRTAMAEAGHATKATATITTNASSHAPKQSQAKQEGLSKVSVEAMVEEVGVAVIKKSSGKESSAPIGTVPSKTNRKLVRSRSRSSKLTVSTASLSTAASVPAVFAPPIAPNVHGPGSIPTRAPSYGRPSAGVHHNEPMGNVTAGSILPYNIPPHMVPQTMLVSNNHSRRMGSGSLMPLAQPLWDENSGLMTSGGYSRVSSGTTSNIHSPHFTYQPMSMTDPLGMPLNVATPYMSGPPMIPVMNPSQTFDPAAIPRNALAYPAVPMATPQMGQVYPHPTHNGPVPRGVSIGEMTNNGYPSNMTAPQYMDPRAPMSRRASNYTNNNSMLFDPYGGMNPRFNDGAGNLRERKASQNGFINPPGQPRKSSNPGNRPGWHGGDRSGGMPSNGPRYPELSFPRIYQEVDDIAITSDERFGCNSHRIGPENVSVTELFVGNVPDSVQEADIRLLFQQQTGVTPSKIDLKPSKQGAYFGHAFVSFGSSAETKKAFQIHDRNPRLRNGSITVSITVPKRFFSERKGNDTDRRYPSSGSYNGSLNPRPTEERNMSSNTRMSSHQEEGVLGSTASAAPDERPLYSPQDVRSGPAKKPFWQSDHTDTALMKGSPEARKPKRNKASPTKKQKDKLIEPNEKDVDVDEEVKVVAKDTDATVADLVESDVKSAIANAQVSEETGTNTRVQEKSGSTNDTGSEDEIASLTDTTNTASDIADMPLDVPPKQLSPSDASTSTLDGEKPETQVLLRSSHLEIQAPVVKIPSKKEDAAVPMPGQPYEESNIAEGKELVKEITEAPSQQVEDTISDDDLNNDTSFQSAQETQPVKVDSELGLGYGDESLPANHKITGPKSVATQQSPQPAHPCAQKAAVEHDSSQISQKPLAASEPDCPSIPEKVTVEDKAEDTSTATQNIKVASVENTENTEVAAIDKIEAQTAANMATSPIVPAVNILKKAGAQRIESLSPFAKYKKTHSKKEKVQKKKQQKKEQAEAERAKAANKSLTSTSSHRDSDPKATDTQSEPTGLASSTSEISAKSTGSAQATHVQADSEPVARKEDEHHVVSSMDHQDEVLKSEVEDEYSSKPDGGNTTNNPSVIGSVTHKTDIAQSTTVKPMEQASSKVSGAPSVALPESVCANAVGHAADASRQAEPSLDPAMKTNGANALLKKNKPPTVVPHLQIPLCKSPTHAEGPQLSSVEARASLTSTSLVSKEAAQGMPNTISPDAASAGSSATLLPENTTMISRPPTANQQFFTPLPIPSAFAPAQKSVPEVEAASAVTPQNNVSKKKKNKTKSKKKTKNLNASSPESTASAKPAGQDSSSSNGIKENYVVFDPFSSQMSHIDAIRRAVKEDTGSYFHNANAKMAAEKEGEEKATKEKHAAPVKKMSEPNLACAIDAYMRENPARFSGEASKKLSQQDLD